MAQEKLSTQEILARARKQDTAGAGSAPAAPAGDAPSPTPSTPAETSAAAPAAAPKSTADILAAARAQKAAKGEVPAAGGAAPVPKAAAKPAGVPKSTADILAAARAQGKGVAAPAVAAAAPAAPKPAVKAAAASAGDRPKLQEMLKALHEGKPVAAVGERPPLPGKPPLPAKRPEPVVTRRAWPVVAAGTVMALIATPFALGWTLMALIGGLWSLLGARFMMPNMVVELPSKFKVGPPSDFPGGTVSEKYKASRGVWIVHSDAYNGENIIYALASVCTHLGCTPNWLEGEQKFKCPCHGSGFYISGINFEGPAPRPLERVGLRVSEDGMLEVDKSVKFQEELGQWQDQKSYVALG
jgi:cytochrome b6-f complex iron-sulfur subunit